MSERHTFFDEDDDFTAQWSLMPHEVGRAFNLIEKIMERKCSTPTDPAISEEDAEFLFSEMARKIHNDCLAQNLDTLEEGCRLGLSALREASIGRKVDAIQRESIRHLVRTLKKLIKEKVTVRPFDRFTTPRVSAKFPDIDINALVNDQHLSEVENKRRQIAMDMLAHVTIPMGAAGWVTPKVKL